MNFTGVFKKMQTEWESPVQYYLDTDNAFLSMNQLIGKVLKWEHTGYQCFNCQLDLEIFGMGYCKSCFFKVPQTQTFIVRPELSKAHLGEEVIDLEWETALQIQPHIVYLANSGGLKVGVTRKTQIPTRWIDQGATQALPIVEVENRYLAGLTEVALAQHVADKTNYRKMLSSQIPQINLSEWKHSLTSYIPEETQKYILEDETVFNFEFPVENFPLKIVSVNFKKYPEIEGKLIGIKGQYLLFENGNVFNIRSHEGYRYSMQVN